MKYIYLKIKWGYGNDKRKSKVCGHCESRKNACFTFTETVDKMDDRKNISASWNTNPELFTE